MSHHKIEETTLHRVIMERDDFTLEEAHEVILDMVRLFKDGESLEEVLYHYSLELDYGIEFLELVDKLEPEI